MSAPGSPPMPTPPPGGGGAPPPGAGGAPPGAGGPPQGGTGAAATMRPMQGNSAQALTLVGTALEALQKALNGLPMGSQIHTAVLKSIIDISRRMNNDQGDKSSKIQALAAMGRDLQANPQAAALQRMQAGGGGGGGPPQPQPPTPPSS